MYRKSASIWGELTEKTTASVVASSQAEALPRVAATQLTARSKALPTQSWATPWMVSTGWVTAWRISPVLLAIAPPLSTSHSPTPFSDSVLFSVAQSHAS